MAAITFMRPAQVGDTVTSNPRRGPATWPGNTLPARLGGTAVLDRLGPPRVRNLDAADSLPAST